VSVNYAAILRTAAAGRREYASGAHAELLAAEADAYEFAAALIDGTVDRADFLRSACPSWRWAELGVDLG